MSETRVHTLYRFFDIRGRLLYVGRTVDARSRWRSHERTKEWFDDVATVTRQVYPDAEALDAAERLAISQEGPLHNIALNGARNSKARPRPVLKFKQSDWLADDLFVSRVMAMAGTDATTITPAAPCDAPNVESWCECFLCHRERMTYLDAVEGDYDCDPVMEQRIAGLRASYARGELIGFCLDALFDLRLFRTLELVAFSRVRPAPALATPTEFGLTVGCPFCQGVHEHFLRSGEALGPLKAGCDSLAGSYLPTLDLDESFEGYADWLAAEQRYRERSAA